MRLPVCITCHQEFTPEKGEINAQDNTGSCDQCLEIQQRVTILITDPVAISAIQSKKADILHVSTQRQAAEAKNRNRGKKPIKRDPKLEKTYRNRASYAAAHDVRSH